MGSDREIALQRRENREIGEVFKKGFSGHRALRAWKMTNDIEKQERVSCECTRIYANKTAVSVSDFGPDNVTMNAVHPNSC